MINSRSTAHVSNRSRGPSRQHRCRSSAKGHRSHPTGDERREDHKPKPLRDSTDSSVDNDINGARLNKPHLNQQNKQTKEHFASEINTVSFALASGSSSSVLLTTSDKNHDF
ncbi:hypothetical protein LOK49_LG05G03718 [Camellia lanceoleosa]|uniref:Uncharacterized protein n=1 Tax=Camellia lanceoleosa TaxID=1840588 RepID=A0ACC0HSF6_9ERIC|nr:hypothetical protein LOK49_LG05G03718 [Camellia lanceoleosa]